MNKKPRSGGAAPYGYSRTDDGFEPDPKEAPIRRKIFQLFLKHKRKLSVAKELNKQGYRTRSQANFSDSSIDRFLRDPIVIGHHKDNFLPASGSKKYTVLKPESEWRYAPLQHIVDDDIWKQVQSLLNKQNKKPAHKKPVAVFSDYIFCTCGGKMHRPFRRHSYYCAVCSNSIEAETIEMIFGEKLKGFSVNNKILKKIFPHKLSGDHHNSRQLFLQKKSNVEEKLEKLYELYISSSISKERFEQKNKPLENRLAEINHSLSSIDSEREDKADILDSSTIQDIWVKQPDQSKRQIVETLTQRIEVNTTAINITFRFSPS